MKATDLMIGNLVEYKGVYYKVIDILTYRDHGKVTLQRKGLGITTIVGVKVEFLSPVPITEEILDSLQREKHSIYHPGGLTRYPLNDLSSIYWNGEEADVSLYRNSEQFVITDTFTETHKLQQALHYAGINDNIELDYE